MKRRELLKWLNRDGRCAVAAWQAMRKAALKEIRIGYQKTGVLVIARQQGDPWKNILPREGIAVKWIEFTSGPPMMEAMSTGSVDLRRGRRYPADLRAGGQRQHRLCRGLSRSPTGRASWCRAIPAFARIADLKGKTRRRRQGHQRAQRPDRDAGKSRPDLRGHHAGLSVAAGCGAGLRQRQHRRLGDLGSVFCDRREKAERPDSRQRAGGRKDQFVLYRQPRFCECPPARNPRDHRW